MTRLESALKRVINGRASMTYVAHICDELHESVDRPCVGRDAGMTDHLCEPQTPRVEPSHPDGDRVGSLGSRG